MSKKVIFKGQIFWFLEEEDGSGPLAPLSHCSEQGEIEDLRVALLEDSYAHVFSDGHIKRHGTVIGHKDELMPV